jgi:serine/threonine protein kinase/Tfp pilus assembly protein PilF
MVLSFPVEGIASELAGAVLGRYRLLQTVGEGGMGTVWMAEQEEPVRRRVALKIIKLGMDTKEVIARFESERQALALMDHPNIAKVLDAGATAEGRPYFVMELVHGVKLTEYCDQNRLSTSERLELFVQSCRAIQHAHQKGIIHRDIKPSNLLVSMQDGVPVPKVIDFGIAKATSGQRLTDKTLITELEQVIGTPAYMSPEQAEMTSLDIDTRSDIYSLGVVLYELLTGRTPFDPAEMLAGGVDSMRRTIRETEPVRPSVRLSTMVAADRTELARRHHTEPPKLIQTLRGDLDWVVLKCLEKDRTRRYETANDLALDVQRHLDCEPVEARPPSNLYRFRRLVRRNKLAVSAVAIISALVVAGAVISAWQAQVQRRLRLAAQQAQGRAETAANQSREVAQFLESMLEGVSPSLAKQHDTTILRHILDQTVERLASLQDQPAVEAELRNTIGVVYTALGQYQLAEQMHRLALAARQKLFGNQSLDVAGSLANLGDSLLQEGNSTEAESCFRRALAIEEGLFGPEDPNTATCQNSLARVLAAEGKLPEAEDYCRRSLDTRRKLLGENNPAVTISLNLLATVLEGQGKFNAAESLAREALQKRKAVLGEDDPGVAISLSNLGTVLRQEGKLQEARSLYEQALALSRKVFTPEHPNVATALNNLANVLRDQNHLQEAKALASQALEIRRKAKLPESIADSLDTLAAIMSDESKLSGAESHLREALALREESWGDEHPAVAATLSRLGSLLEKEGRFDEATGLLRRCLSIREKKIPDSWLTYHSRSELGGSLMRQKNYGPAESLLLSGYEGMQRRIQTIPAGSRLFVKDSIQGLIDFYQATQRPAKAAPWKTKLDDFTASTYNASGQQ